MVLRSASWFCWAEPRCVVSVMAEGHDEDSLLLPPCSSPPQPPWSLSEPDKAVPVRQPSTGFYEELFWSLRAPVPLAGAFMSSGPQSDVVKQGYLGKLDRNRRRYFVLRAGSHTGPSRLEWYKSRERFTAVEKSAGRSVLFGSNKQGVVYLRCCLGVSRIGNSRKGHVVELYAKDHTVVLLAEDQQQNQDWYAAIKTLMEEEQRDEEHGAEEDDDGYCTLPPGSFFKEVWPVSVKPRGLGSSKPLSGENRLCLTATSLVLVRLGAGSELPSVTIPLLSVRRFGHLDGLFYLELGRSAPNGPGEIWMEAKQQALAQQIHESIRETVRALRALPGLSGSPASSHSQHPGLWASKRCRPKNRDRPGNVRPAQSRTSDPQKSPAPSPLRSNMSDDGKPDTTSSPLSPSRTQQGPASGAAAAACKLQSWSSSEGEELLGYMVMTPQAGIKPSAPPQDDYVTMESPQRLDRTACSSSSSLHTLFSSLTCDSPSSLHAVDLRCPLALLPGAAPPAVARRDPAPPTACTPRVWRASSGSAVPDPDLLRSAVRRSWLPACLLSCLRGGDRG
ncbi:insulin receptor substrate 1-like isoform X1 [Oryzias latipes]|uniref:insulin receptor substrate 1-like isoform X1 n=2 Tax=Oryzias latipes TaxID=8090 RepID=UPI000CE1987F|nr:insulin receptor substrate 1-like isoform X1 [Oryzias latipes]